MMNENTKKRLNKTAKELEYIIKDGILYNAKIEAMLKANETEAHFNDFDFMCEVRTLQIGIKTSNERLEKLLAEWEEE